MRYVFLLIMHQSITRLWEDLLWWEGLSKNVDYHSWPKTKEKLAIAPKTALRSPPPKKKNKRNLNPSVNDSKSHICNSFSENIILGIQQLFCIRPRVLVDIIKVFSYSRFSSKKSQSQQKLEKNLTHFTNFNSLDIENNMLSKHSQKPFSLYKLSNKHVSVWCQKKHLHCAISWRPRTAFLKHYESKCLCISAYLPKKVFVPKT